MATHADAELILKLYDLRRESVMREARSWFISWWPGSADEAKAIAATMTRQDNAWLRQATSYWEMAFSIANTGAIDAELFARNSGEGIIFALKCQQLAKTFPEVWTRRMAEAETFIAANATATRKAEVMAKRFGWAT
jgi:hypothetical protein